MIALCLQKFRRVETQEADFQRQLMGSSQQSRAQKGQDHQPSRHSCPSCSVPLGLSGNCPNPDCPQSAAFQPRKRAADALRRNPGAGSLRSQGESTARTGHSSVYVDEVHQRDYASAFTAAMA